MRRIVSPSFPLLLLLVALTGCGGGDAAPEVASTGSTSTPMDFAPISPDAGPTAGDPSVDEAPPEEAPPEEAPPEEAPPEEAPPEEAPPEEAPPEEAPPEEAPPEEAPPEENFDPQPPVQPPRQPEPKRNPPPQIPSDQVFLQAAHDLFSQGRDREAFGNYYAHVIDSDKAVAKDIPLHWLPAPLRPDFSVRWGIGVEYLPARNYRIDPVLIGDPVEKKKKDTKEEKRVTAFQPNQQGEKEELKERPEPPKDLGQQFAYFTGEVGDKLMNRLNMRRERAYWGKLTEKIDGVGNFTVGAFHDTTKRNPNQPELVADPDVEIDGGKEAAKRKTALGRMPPVTAESKHIAQFYPGLTYLGEGTTPELTRRAVNEDVDLLLIFRVTTTETRQGTNTNTTEISVTDVATGENVANSGRMNNISIDADRQDNPADDPVEIALDPIFRLIDKEYQSAPMPALTPAVVAGRVGMLFNDHHKHILPVLAEVRWYNAQGLLDDEKLKISYERLLDPQRAEILVGSDQDARRALLSSMLPQPTPPEVDEDAPKVKPAVRPPVRGPLPGAEVGPPGDGFR
ncbi:hypothetical protein [Lignipirellula cremea]|uniref:Uncharacterized protein n=1 Tax=Lignipirellula cremea TaxID=2528010 RepID=A0A518DZ07_9BACT|nr:hypothetical protein [Lignipirellula cremea]QDU97079.1 hypothetical protein Pla8534_49050 [Lignipirellula cremea]